MRGGVAFAVGVVIVEWNGLVEISDHIAYNIGVGVFVDSDARRGVRHEYRHQTAFYAAFGEGFFELTGDV